MLSKIVVLALVASVEARHRHHKHRDLVGLRGIDPDDLMQNQASHWRKAWPQGNTDDGENDEDVLNIGAPRRRTEKKPDPEITYPWTLDEDVIHTQKHLADVEAKMNKKFTSYQDRGFTILNSGDAGIKSPFL